MAQEVGIVARWFGADAKRGIDQTKADVRSIGTSSQTVGRAFQQLGLDIGGIGATVATLGPPMAALAASAMVLKRGFSESAQEELALKKLGQAASNLGQDMETAKEEASDAATQLQRLSGIADDEGIAAIKRMTIATGDFHQSMKDMQLTADVAIGGELDMASAARAVSMAREGQVRGIGALIPSLRAEMEMLEGTESLEKRVDMAMKALHERFDGQAAASMDTMSGRIKSLGQSFGDFSQAVFEGLNLDDATKGTALVLTSLFNSATDYMKNRPTNGKLFDLTTSNAGSSGSLEAILRERMGLSGPAPIQVPGGTFPVTVGGSPNGPMTFEDFYAQLLRGIPTPNGLGPMPGAFTPPGQTSTGPIGPTTMRELMGGGDDWWFEMKGKIKKDAPEIGKEFEDVWDQVGDRLHGQLAGAFTAALSDGRGFAQALAGILKQELGSLFSDLLRSAIGGGGFTPLSILGGVLHLGNQGTQRDGALQDNLNRRLVRQNW